MAQRIIALQPSYVWSRREWVVSITWYGITIARRIVIWIHEHNHVVIVSRDIEIYF